MIAYHFPPTRGSSGVHRTVQFAKHLPKFDWEPLILTVHPRAYPSVGKDMLGGLPESVVIKRAQAFDSARHFSFRNRYLDLTAIPDRWVTWWPHGVLSGLELIKNYNPSVIWSTYPIASAHLIALTIQQLTGLPWIADFRDPMNITSMQGQLAGIDNRVVQWIERKTIEHSSAGLFVTQSALEQCIHRYPDKPSTYWKRIENGYDESLFLGVKTLNRKGANYPIKLLHSGILYSKGRNPFCFFQALRSYLDKGGVPVEVILRGAGQEIDIEGWIFSLGLKDIVKIKPPISYKDAIEEMMQSDALLMIQGAEYNKQIPAKIYEYIRAGKPILALTDALGESARLLKYWDGVYMGNMEDADEIESALDQIVDSIQNQEKPIRDPKAVSKLSRKAGTLKLSKILNEFE